MFRKLLLPLLAIVLLGGCVSTGYGYRNAPRGDYYHGYPSTDYRVYGDYRYSRGYGYWPYSGYRGGYGYYPYYRGGYYGYPGYRPPIVVRPRPDNDHERPRNDRDRAPWRDLDRIRRDRTPTVERRPLSTAPRPAVRPSAPATRPPAQRVGGDRGSRMGQAIRKARGDAARRVERQVE